MGLLEPEEYLELLGRQRNVNATESSRLLPIPAGANIAPVDFPSMFPRLPFNTFKPTKKSGHDLTLLVEVVDALLVSPVQTAKHPQSPSKRASCFAALANALSEPPYAFLALRTNCGVEDWSDYPASAKAVARALPFRTHAGP